MTKTAMKDETPNYDEMFEAVEQREHILNEPDMYMGSIHKTQLSTWVLCPDTGKMVLREIEYVPGLFKCFDEILVNAIDARTRSEMAVAGLSKVPKNALVTKVDVSWDAQGKIVVRNNGPGIPVQKNTKLDIWIPEMIFGRCLTSSNYKKENRITGGKNGLGAKLANIFSREFAVETVDGASKRKFTMRWTDNMSKTDAPQIIEGVKGDTYTEITYLPDFARFGLPGFTDDLRALFERRIYDAAAWLGPEVDVTLNGARVDVGGLSRYALRFLPDGAELVHEVVNPRWTVAVALSPDHAFQQVSFVNGICTTKGGKHVDAVVSQICKHMAEWIHLKKKREVKPAIIREHLAVFLRAVIECPSFDSQTKETLTTPMSKFGSKCELSKSFFDELSKTELMERILESLDTRDLKDLKKTDGKKVRSLRGIPKLDDANNAGTNKSEECTLILTEGDSAKTFAISGLSVVGRENYGVYPLRGKLLNVRDAPKITLRDNKELNELKQIIGLQQDKEYTSAKGLRYGKIMLLCDSDVDGAHIRGLAMNMFHALWPSLWKIPGFLCTMRTPIVKAKKGKETQVFYALPEYNEWRKATQNGKGWEIKYYKGLGTSTAVEARSYFEDLLPAKGGAAKKQKLIVEYHPGVTDEDPEAKECHNAMSLAFDKKRADDRKEWLSTYSPDLCLGPESKVSYREFVNKELIHFSSYDNTRSIPSMVDGLKPSQRKVLYACLKRNLRKEIKVAQLAGYVSEQTSYHHGEQSLNDTIINMAQDYVGSNNIPYLSPNGQFGTRIQGGKDAASPRYIFTELGPLTRLLFRPEDDVLLKYLDDDGTPIEPEYYVPILPTALLNGSEGIGTGFSTSIPAFHPLTLARAVRQLLRGEEPKDKLMPWYRGFTGTIAPVVKKGRGSKAAAATTDAEGGNYETRGRVQVIDKYTLEIQELPVGVWTQDYKEFLESLIGEDNASSTAPATTSKKRGTMLKGQVRAVENHYTDSNVRFRLIFSIGTVDKLSKLSSEELEKELCLCGSISMSNMRLFDTEGRIHRYALPEDILRDFFRVRLDFYRRRHALLLKQYDRDARIAEAKKRFLEEIIRGDLVVFRRPRGDVEEDLRNRGFPCIQQGADLLQDDPDADGDYQYLISMPIHQFTEERMRDLAAQVEKLRQAYEDLRAKTPEDLWIQDLDEFESAYVPWEQKMNQRSEAELTHGTGDVTSKKKKAATTKAK